MTEENSVVDDPEEGSRNASEVHGAQEDDLEALLSEWDSQEVETESESKDVTKDDLKAFLEEYRQDKQERLSEQTSKDIGEAVTAIREQMGEGAPSEKTVRRLLNGAAGEDPRLRTAWMQRHQNPEGYRRVLKGLAKEFSEDFSGKPDRNLTEDREAVRAAVRGASTRTSSDDPDIPDFTGKSDAEFEQWVRSQKR